MLVLYSKSRPCLWYLNTDNTQIHSSSLDVSSVLQSPISSCLMGMFILKSSAKTPSPAFSLLVVCTQLPKTVASEIFTLFTTWNPMSFLFTSSLPFLVQVLSSVLWGNTAIPSQLVFQHLTSSHLKTHLPHNQNVIFPKPIWLLLFPALCNSFFLQYDFYLIHFGNSLSSESCLFPLAFSEL